MPGAGRLSGAPGQKACGQPPAKFLKSGPGGVLVVKPKCLPNELFCRVVIQEHELRIYCDRRGLA